MWWSMPNSSIPRPTDTHIESEWAVHQVATTVNFATHNKVWNWLFGGLNFQVEHHLFPRISHVHYPEMNKRLKEVCAEFDIQYREFPTMRSALVVTPDASAAGGHGLEAHRSQTRRGSSTNVQEPLSLGWRRVTR